MNKDLIGRIYPEITVSDSAKMTVQECVAETPREDLKIQAVRHYEYLSSLAHEWSSYCSNAIKEYEINKDKIKKLEADLEIAVTALEQINSDSDKCIASHSDEFKDGSHTAFSQQGELAKQALEKIGRGNQ